MIAPGRQPLPSSHTQTDRSNAARPSSKSSLPGRSEDSPTGLENEVGLRSFSVASSATDRPDSRIMRIGMREQAGHESGGHHKDGGGGGRQSSDGGGTPVSFAPQGMSEHGDMTLPTRFPAPSPAFGGGLSSGFSGDSPKHEVKGLHSADSHRTAEEEAPLSLHGKKRSTSEDQASIELAPDRTSDLSGSNSFLFTPATPSKVVMRHVLTKHDERPSSSTSSRASSAARGTAARGVAGSRVGRSNSVLALAAGLTAASSPSSPLGTGQAAGYSGASEQDDYENPGYLEGGLHSGDLHSSSASSESREVAQ